MSQQEVLARELFAACLRVPGVQVGLPERLDEKSGFYYQFQASNAACLRFSVYADRVRVELYGMDRKKGVFAALELVEVEVGNPAFERRVGEFVARQWECPFPTHWRSR